MNWAKTAGFIILAYVVFTTMKGNLRRWLQIIGLKPDDSGTGAGVIGSGLGMTQGSSGLNSLGLRGRF